MLYGTVAGLSHPVSRLVLGSVVFKTAPPERLRTTFDLLDAFVALGGTMVDTAYVYGGGESERAIGLWLHERASADKLMVLTKGAHPLPGEPRRVTPAAIDHDLTISLERLGTDHVDLYLLHRDDPDVPVGLIVDCLNRQADEGRIRAFGGSNWTTRRIDEANDYAASHRLQGFVASSPNLSLAVPKEPRWPGCLYADAATRAWHRERQFPLFSWSSQAGGFFSGRFSPDSPDDPDTVRVYYADDNWERLRRARELAAQKGRTPIQVALAWVLAQPFPTFPLIGPRTVDELRDSAAALEVQLTPEEVAWLDLEA